MAKSHNVEPKKPDLNEYITYNSIYVNSNTGRLTSGYRSHDIGCFGGGRRGFLREGGFWLVMYF